jgi:hypothetical protein
VRSKKDEVRIRAKKQTPNAQRPTPNVEVRILPEREKTDQAAMDVSAGLQTFHRFGTTADHYL